MNTQFHLASSSVYGPVHADQEFAHLRAVESALKVEKRARRERRQRSR